MTDIKVESLKEQGYVECPRCRMYHNNLLNPEAVTTKLKGPKHGEQEVITKVSVVCDKCCNTLLEAFADSDWPLFWPTITQEEADNIVTRIKASKKAQFEYYRKKVA
jgi:hypothetical protein